MATTTFEHRIGDWLRQRRGQVDGVQVTVTEQQSMTIPADVQCLQVVSGGAWISYHGRDIILRPGDVFEFDGSRYPAVVTALNHRPVTLLLGN